MKQATSIRVELNRCLRARRLDPFPNQLSHLSDVEPVNIAGQSEGVVSTASLHLIAGPTHSFRRVSSLH